MSRAGAGGRQPGRQHQPWVANRIADTQRAARETTCKRCGRDTLTGTDDDKCAATITVDPTPLDELHEVHALLMGRGSYDLIRGQLHYRTIDNYRNRKYPIFARHECENGK